MADDPRAATTGRGDDQCENHDLVREVTRIVREADVVFERVGGSSRHWVRDCFLPMLNDAGFRIVKAKEKPHAG